MVFKQRKSKNNNTKFNLRLISLLVLFFAMIIYYIFIVSPVSLKQIALALSPNYNKAVGDYLNVTDWNTLDDDFVAKSGDTMTGILDMGNNKITNLADPDRVNPADSATAANRQYVDNGLIGLGENIQDITGAILHVYCGQTPAGSTNWIGLGDNRTVYVDVTLPAGLFSSTPYFFTSLGGSGEHYKAIGATSIFSPTSRGFRVMVYYTDDRINMTAGQANAWQWRINWCGVGR